MIIATATIVRGVKSNRVKRVRQVRQPRPARPPLFRADARGRGAKKSCISLDVGQLAALDHAALQRGQARSHVIWDALEELLARPDRLQAARVKAVCITLPPELAAALDAAVELLGASRSRLIQIAIAALLTKE